MLWCSLTTSTYRLSREDGEKMMRLVSPALEGGLEALGEEEEEEEE